MLFSDVKKGLTSFIRNDVLVAKITPCFENGKGCYTENLKTEVGVGSTEFHVLRANDLADGKFVYFWTVQQSFREILTQEMVGSAGHKRVPFSSIQKFQIPLPSLPEQTAIATVLSDTDRLLTTLRALIGKKRAVKTAAMQQLLSGRLRLPGFATNGSLKNSELGEIPEDWEVVKLGEVAEVKSGGTPSTSNKDFWDGEIAWCTPTDITALKGGKYLMQTSRNITKSGLQYSAAELLPVDSIVMTSRATIGECAIAKIPVTTNQGFKNFICFDKVDSEFIYYLLGMQKKRFVALCAGSTFLEININQVRNFQVALPKSKSEQTAIAQTLSDMDSEIAALEARAAKLAHIKQGLMQNLLTGKIRVNNEAA